MEPSIYINEIFLQQLPFSPQEPTSTTSSSAVIAANYLNVFMVSPNSTFEGPDDMPPALIALNDSECTSDSGSDEASGSILNIAMDLNDVTAVFRHNDYEATSTQTDSEKKTFRKRPHSALMADEAKEKVMKNRGAEQPPTPPNVGSPFVSDAFVMVYNLAGEEYLNSDIEKFLE